MFIIFTYHSLTMNLPKIKQLLQSEDPNNQELAFLMLESLGIERADTELARLLTRTADHWLRCCQNQWESVLELVEELDFRYQKLTELPDNALHWLRSLRRLTMSHNYLSALPHNLGCLTELRELIVNYNHTIDHLPESVGKLTKLRELSLSGNNIESLPESITKLQQLEILSLIDNKLSDLPHYVAGLHRLRKLSLRGNFLQRLPATIMHLEHLEVVDLGENKLTSLPANLQLWQRLSILYLDGNGLSPRERERVSKLLPNTAIYF